MTPLACRVYCCRVGVCVCVTGESTRASRFITKRKYGETHRNALVRVRSNSLIEWIRAFECVGSPRGGRRRETWPALAVVLRAPLFDYLGEEGRNVRVRGAEHSRQLLLQLGNRTQGIETHFARFGRCRASTVVITYLRQRTPFGETTSTDGLKGRILLMNGLAVILAKYPMEFLSSPPSRIYLSSAGVIVRPFQ